MTRSRSFEVKFANKGPLTHSNIPTTFRWNNYNRLGESAEIGFFSNLKWPPFRGI